MPTRQPRFEVGLRVHRLIRPGLPAALHHAKPKSAAPFSALIISENGMAESRRETDLGSVWLKCFRGVAGAPQIYELVNHFTSPAE
jgi:hypothetical protein